MKTYAHLAVEFRDHTAVVTIQNPPANTWNRDSLLALETLIADLNQNRDIYALVLTGEGEKFFSAGADLKLFAEGDKAVAREMARLFGRALRRYRIIAVSVLLPSMAMPWGRFRGGLGM